MNRRMFVMSTMAATIGFSAAPRLVLQKKVIEPDLAALADAKRLQLFNRTAERLTDGTKRGVRLSEAQGDGIAYLPNVEFGDGTIECDLRGKDVLQQSFLGIAFHGVDSATYDAVYFRPFNFRAEDPVRRRHAVQYHSNPNFGWQRLRTEHPDEYEKAVNPVPDPNRWFHMRLVVASPTISMFVDDGKAPSLVVKQLSNRRKGLVGLWVGNSSAGEFANLAIVQA
jgi:hypothetical protein